MRITTRMVLDDPRSGEVKYRNGVININPEDVIAVYQLMKRLPLIDDNEEMVKDEDGNVLTENKEIGSTIYLWNGTGQVQAFSIEMAYEEAIQTFIPE